MKAVRAQDEAIHYNIIANHLKIWITVSNSLRTVLCSAIETLHGWPDYNSYSSIQYDPNLRGMGKNIKY
jgi:hypothetical protein